MEVHSHTHTPRKKWTHYLWEFLMLFLAVTLSFLVENQREHYIEHKRAKGLVISLLNDLQKDTAQLNMLQMIREKRKLQLDSFYELLKTPPDDIDRRSFYRFVTIALGQSTFSQSTGTVNQLKNAGYLRYFSDNDLINGISEYEFWIQDFKSDEGVEFIWVSDKLNEFINFNLDNAVIEEMTVEKKYPEGNGINFYKPGGLHYLKAIVNELRTDNYIMQSFKNPQLKKEAKKLMQYLHKKYHVE